MVADLQQVAPCHREVNEHKGIPGSIGYRGNGCRSVGQGDREIAGSCHIDAHPLGHCAGKDRFHGQGGNHIHGWMDHRKGELRLASIAIDGIDGDGLGGPVVDDLEGVGCLVIPKPGNAVLVAPGSCTRIRHRYGDCGGTETVHPGIAGKIGGASGNRKGQGLADLDPILAVFAIPARKHGNVIQPG